MTVALTDVVAVIAAFIGLAGTLMIAAAQGTIDFTRDAAAKQRALRERGFGATMAAMGFAAAFAILALTRMPTITWALTP